MIVLYIFIGTVITFSIANFLWGYSRKASRYRLLCETQENCDHQYMKDNNYSYELYSSDLSEKVLHSKFTCHKCGFVKYQEYRGDV